MGYGIQASPMASAADGAQTPMRQLVSRKPGRWYPLFASGTQTGSAAGQNSVRFTPFILSEDMTIDRLQCAVSTAGGAGSLSRFGIWAGNMDLLVPTGLPIAYTGDQNTETTGTYSMALQAASVVLPKDTLLFGAVWHSNNTVALASLANGSPHMIEVIGLPDGLGVNALNGTAPGVSIVRNSVTFAGGNIATLDMTGATFTYLNNSTAIAPALMARSA